MRLSKNQRRILRWLAHSMVHPTHLDARGYGNRRRTVHSLYEAGLIRRDAIDFNYIKLTDAGKKAHAENCRRCAEETLYPFMEVL